MPASPTAGGRVILPRQSNPGGLPGSIALPTPSDTDNADPTSTSTSETPSSTPTSSTESTESSSSTRTPSSTPSFTLSSTPTSTPTSTPESSTRTSRATSSTETSSTTTSSTDSRTTSTDSSISTTSTPVSSSIGTSSLTSLSNVTSAMPFTTLSMNTTSSAGASFTTFTSSIVTEINGTPTTAAVAIVTALNPDSSGDGLDSHERTSIVAGAAVGGTALLVILFAGFFYYRRRVDKQRYTFLKREPPSRAAFLADELAAPPPGGYRDDPFAPPSGAAVGQAYELPARVPRTQHSGNGSIFREDVWPPPQSALEDPFSSTPNLAGAVEGAGPSASSPVPSQSTLGIGQRPGAHDARLRGGSGDASLWSQASAPRPMSETSQTGLMPEHDSTAQGHGRDASDVPLLSDAASAIEYDTRLGPLAPTNPDRHSVELASPPPSGLSGHPNWLERAPRRVDGSDG
ncbi:unnamed protein product [Peniophora sp. CBMAI 1063]|nr:unnamed protein product [Peniophora sp. CBMAI 1063]